MTGDYADLRALAEAATPGPWVRTYHNDLDEHTIYTDDEDFREVAVVNEDRTADAAYIAAANPARIRALLADLDALAAQVEAARALHEADGWGMCDTCDVVSPCPTALAAGDTP